MTGKFQFGANPRINKAVLVKEITECQTERLSVRLLLCEYPCLTIFYNDNQNAIMYFFKTKYSVFTIMRLILQYVYDNCF
jgi:hypothetical protein